MTADDKETIIDCLILEIRAFELSLADRAPLEDFEGKEMFDIRVLCLKRLQSAAKAMQEVKVKG